MQLPLDIIQPLMLACLFIQHTCLSKALCWGRCGNSHRYYKRSKHNQDMLFKKYIYFSNANRGLKKDMKK